jgi:phage terminase large subunit GpA-like protein
LVLWIPKTKERREYKWDLPPGSRDEAGDCTRMAYAALQLVARRYNRATMWDQLEAQLKGPVQTTQIQRRRSAYLTQ